MSLVTVAFVARRIRQAEIRWGAAMRRPGYRDDPNDPDDPEPFSEQDWALWGWADAWRSAVHRFENELDRLPEAARIRASHYAITEQAPTLYDQTHTTESLARTVK